MTLSRDDAERGVDRKFRAKVAIALIAGCLSLWGAVGYFALHAL
jgi:hypothetical protein